MPVRNTGTQDEAKEQVRMLAGLACNYRPFDINSVDKSLKTEINVAILKGNALSKHLPPDLKDGQCITEDGDLPTYRGSLIYF